MDDLILAAKLNDSAMLYVTPIDCATYAESLDDDNLGGADGYFVVRSLSGVLGAQLEVLAKAPSFEAAGELFDLIVATNRQHAPVA